MPNRTVGENILIKSKIDDYTLAVKVRTMEISIHKDDKEVKKIPTKKFIVDGMMLFPKRLYDKIKQELKHANTYDRFLNKFWDWYEEE